MSGQDQRITTAVDSLIEAKNSIRFRDAEGNELPSGRVPRTLDEFVQGIDQLKTQIFDQYDDLAIRQGGQGVRVPLQPAINQLRQLAAEPQVAHVNPNLARQAEEMAQRWEAAASYSPKEMQNVVQSLNQQLKALLRNPTQEAFSHNTMMSQVLGTLRNTLNQTMATALQGPQYQALRNRYASLASIESDVANALRRHAARSPGLIHQAGNLGFWADALYGIATFNPKAIGYAAAIKGSQEINRYLRSPNRAVTRLFAKRAQELDPTRYERLSAEMATRIGEIRQQAYDANVRGNIAEVQRLGNQRRNLTPPSGF
jgi:hypothetical protein